MRLLIEVFLVSLFLVQMMGCSGMPEITKWTSPSMRIAIDPESINSADYVRIQEALVQSGKYFVVDRKDGFNAVVREQNAEHMEDAGRFGESDRYARFARLYGVGAVVIANVQCAKKQNFFTGRYIHCVQSLALVNATTAEVITQVRGTNDDAEHYYGDIKIASDWTDTVNKLNDAIPKNVEFEQYDKRMTLHRAEIREDSIREQEGKQK